MGGIQHICRILTYHVLRFQPVQHRVVHRVASCLCPEELFYFISSANKHGESLGSEELSGQLFIVPTHMSEDAQVPTHVCFPWHHKVLQRTHSHKHNHVFSWRPGAQRGLPLSQRVVPSVAQLYPSRVMTKTGNWESWCREGMDREKTRRCGNKDNDDMLRWLRA